MDMESEVSTNASEHNEIDKRIDRDKEQDINESQNE